MFKVSYLFLIKTLSLLSLVISFHILTLYLVIPLSHRPILSPTPRPLLIKVISSKNADQLPISPQNQTFRALNKVVMPVIKREKKISIRRKSAPAPHPIPLKKHSATAKSPRISDPNLPKIDSPKLPKTKQSLPRSKKIAPLRPATSLAASTAPSSPSKSANKKLRPDTTLPSSSNSSPSAHSPSIHSQTSQKGYQYAEKSAYRSTPPATVTPSKRIQLPPQKTLASESRTPPRYQAAYLHNPHPPYPLLSQRRGEEGTVLLHVQVSTQGRAQQITLQRSSGFSKLDDSALQTVQQQWRFVPAKQGDQVITAWVTVPITFRLQ